MEQSKNSDIKIIQNNENYSGQQNKIIQKEYENEKEEDNEIIIELLISNDEKEKEINILCDKEQLIKENEDNKDYYKKNKINPPKEFNYFNKNNTKLYLNDKEIEFNHKLKCDKNGTNKIKIKSNIKLFTLSTMFYNCRNIKTIKFIKFNTNNVTNMSRMFDSCENLSELNLSSFNTNNVNNMCRMFASCENLSKLNLSSFNTNNVTDMNGMFFLL